MPSVAISSGSRASVLVAFVVVFVLGIVLLLVVVVTISQTRE
jgi:hypothetical protein